MPATGKASAPECYLLTLPTGRAPDTTCVLSAAHPDAKVEYESDLSCSRDLNF